MNRKKVFAIWILGVLFLSLGAVPVFQGKHVSADTLPEVQGEIKFVAGDTIVGRWVYRGIWVQNGRESVEIPWIEKAKREGVNLHFKFYTTHVLYPKKRELVAKITIINENTKNEKELTQQYFSVENIGDIVDITKNIPYTSFDNLPLGQYTLMVSIYTVQESLFGIIKIPDKLVTSKGIPLYITDKGYILSVEVTNNDDNKQSINVYVDGKRVTGAMITFHIGPGGDTVHISSSFVVPPRKTKSKLVYPLSPGKHVVKIEWIDKDTVQTYTLDKTISLTHDQIVAFTIPLHKVACDYNVVWPAPNSKYRVPMSGTFSLKIGSKTCPTEPPRITYISLLGSKVVHAKFSSLGYNINSKLFEYKVQLPDGTIPGEYDISIGLSTGQELHVPHALRVYNPSQTQRGNNVDIAFIIDNSGSMSWNDPNGLRGEAVKMFIDQLDIGDAVSIISFEGSANVLVPMTVIDSKSTKEQLISQVRTWARDGTSLSAGLNAGYQQLLNSPSGNPEKVAIMLTDGVGSYSNEAELYKQQGWPVYTVGLGHDINPQLLSKIATETGGIYLHADKPEDIMQIYNIIKGKVKRQQTLSSTSVQLSPGQSVLRGAYVDPTVSSTTFSVSWPGSDVNLTLISPDGTIITPETAQADTNITYTKGDTYVIYEINNPLPGEWKMNITAVDVPETGEEVTAMVLADTNLTIDLFTEKSTYKLGEPVRLVGVLTLNGEPVEGIVNATVIKPDGSVEYLQLLDDNNDGVYETYYVPKEAGTYTVTLQASGEVKGVPFTRQEAFSVHVSSEQPQVEFKASIDKFSISTVSGKTLSLDFTINSTVQDIVRIGLTSLSNGTNTIAANYTVSSGVLEMVPDENVPIHFDLTVPFDAEPGNYTGEIVIQGTSSVLTIPIELEVKPRLLHAPKDVELYSTNVNVESIGVYEISEDTLKQITGDVPEVKNLKAFIITSAGFGDFKLRFSNISEVENVKVFKYDIESKKWKQTSFEVGSVIVPLSVNGFNIELVVIGGAKTPTKETSSYTDIITLSRLWTTWFFKYYEEFNSLYTNATAMNISNETLQRALELHNNATALILKAWHREDINYIKEHVWGHIVSVPQLGNVRKAFLMERDAVNLLKEALKGKD